MSSGFKKFIDFLSADISVHAAATGTVISQAAGSRRFQDKPKSGAHVFISFCRKRSYPNSAQPFPILLRCE